LADAHNVKLVGYSDLQGRNSLQIALKENYAYVGHLKGAEFNPLTGEIEPNGTTILDVSDPKEPIIVKHIPGHKGANCRAVQVVTEFYDGKDYILRNLESSAFTGFEVWEVTNKKHPKLISTIGPLEEAHKSWWDAHTGYAYLSGKWPGWRGRHLVIYDLRNPRKPQFVSNWGLPGQDPKDMPGPQQKLHHPVISGDRCYLSYTKGGNTVILDVSDKHSPRVIANITFVPPFGAGPHTTAPFSALKCPNFTAGYGDIRNFLVICQEAGDADYKCQEIRTQLFIVDATEEKNPLPVATFKVPDGNFCDRGGRFGPHQFAETKDGEIIGGSLLYIAYFSAGLRIVDLEDPFKPQEVGYYIPDTNAKTKPLLKKVIQTNDVDLDYRGLIYITDRVGTGLHILEYTREE